MPTAPPATVATGGLLTTDELAHNLRRSHQTIRRWVGDGMPAQRVNRRLHFDPAKVDAWLSDRNSQSPASDHRTAIKRLVDAAPELTAEQAERIRAVLTGGAV